MVMPKKKKSFFINYLFASAYFKSSRNFKNLISSILLKQISDAVDCFKSMCVMN
jgi:hypothetical protein